MRQQAGTVPTYLAMGLAALAAIMSGPQPRVGNLDAAVLWLLTAEAAAIDMPPATGDALVPFASP